VEECGYHCAGQSVPNHICDAMEEPRPGAEPDKHAGHPMAHGERAMSPAEAMGHGGHAAMSTAAMVRDMRNRFLVALMLSVPILLWSSIGRGVLHFDLPAPFGIRDDVFQLVLSLPVVFYSSWIFFDGAFRAVRHRTLDIALAQIVKLVQEAQNSKAPGQQLADRAAFWLVLVALVGGAGTFAVWMLTGASVHTAILFAITVVVITCPDALGLATPTAIMVGTGLGAARGILFKNAMALETSARIQVVVMDKTGTLTKGEPEVVEVVAPDLSERELLRLASAVERESEHPLAQAIVRRAAATGAEETAAREFTNIPGHGAVATVDGHRVAVGNTRLLEREEVNLNGLREDLSRLSATGRTVVTVAIDGKAAGLLAIADAARPSSRAAIAALRSAGIEVVMLTGDNQATAERVAGELGIQSVIAEVLPGDKAKKISELQESGKKVAMVGDGVNDAPALAQADLGIAIGAGTDVAIETADIVLMRSDPLDVATAFAIGRGTLRKMRQNLAWAVGYNAIALPIAAGVFEPAFGLVLRPEIAALSMSGSSVLVAVNALLLRGLRLPRQG
jgi:P-type Cu2+ transporter